MQVGKRDSFFCSIVLFVVMLIPGLHAQVSSNVIPRIGVVDLKRVYDAAKSADPSMKELDRLREQLNTEITSRKEEIQALKEERVTAMNNSNTTLADEIALEIKRKENELKAFHQNAGNQVRKVQKDSRDDTVVRELVTRAVSAVARTRGYTVIFASNSGDLIYWTDKVDITNEVIAQLTRMT